MPVTIDIDRDNNNTTKENDMTNIIEIVERIEETTIAMKRLETIISALDEAYNDSKISELMNNDLIKSQRDDLYVELRRLNQIKKASMKQISSL